MQDFVDNCIVLKIHDYRDDDRLATALTADNGMVTLLFRGVKKAKAKLKPFAQAFCVFNARFIANRGKFLTPVEPTLLQDGFVLCSDLMLFTAASVASEATVAALGDNQAHPETFIEFFKLIKALRFNGDPYYQTAVYVCELLKQSGFYREYPFTDSPQTPPQMLGYAQVRGYEKSAPRDLSRRALKYICAEFSRNFDCAINAADSIDLYV